MVSLVPFVRLPYGSSSCWCRRLQSNKVVTVVVAPYTDGRAVVVVLVSW